MASIKLHLFGPPRCMRDGEFVKLSTAKGLALLAYLAVTGTPQRRERMMDLLWPDSRPHAARKNLRNTLWAIRQALGDGVLHVESQSGWPTLALNEALWVDLWQWERLLGSDVGLASQQVAIDLYGGLLLDGVEVTAAPDFEIWLTTERERLERAQIRLLEGVVAVHQRESKWEEVIALAQQVLHYDPLQEPMHRALMEAHARLGQRSEALRQYDILQEILERELGVPPLPESEALREAILSGEVVAIAPPASREKRLVSQNRSALRPFIGREMELAALDAELERATRGEARVVLLVGELGIGKSRLWQTWSSSLSSDSNTTILETACIDTTQALPFAPLTELFRTHTCMQRLFGPDSPVAPVWLAEMARLLPELGNHEQMSMFGLPPLPPEEERHRLFEAFTQTLRALDARPLIFFIDDLHWADQATLDWLVYLVHRLRKAPLLLVGSYRPEDMSPQLLQMSASWARQGVLRRLSLAPLNEKESSQLMASLGADVALAERARQQSGGNPYFLTEFAQFVQRTPDDTPSALADLVCARVEQLPNATRQVLQAAAILAPDFCFTSLRSTSGRGEEETLNALDALLDHRFLIERGERYRFTHPFVAGVMRVSLSRARRRFLHRRAGAIREAIAQLPQQAGQLATHFAEAGEEKRAAHFAELAAQHALTLAAPAEAVAFYQQALELEPTPTRQMGLAEALQWQGELAAAQSAFESARLAFEKAGNEQEAARACLKLAEALVVAGGADEVLHAAERSLLYLGSNSSTLRAFAHFMLGTGHLETGGSFSKAETHLKQAIQLATKQNQADIAARSHFTLGNLLAERGDLKAARRAFDDSIALAEQAKDPYQRTFAHNNAAYHALLDRDLDAAQQHIQKGLALSQTYALRIPRQYLYSTRGEIALAEKKWQEANNWFQRGLAEAQSHQNLKQVAKYRANLALAAHGSANLTQAITLMEHARREAANLTARHLQSQIDLWLTELYLAANQRQAAKTALKRAQTRLAGSKRRELKAWAARLQSILRRASATDPTSGPHGNEHYESHALFPRDLLTQF